MKRLLNIVNGTMMPGAAVIAVSWIIGAMFGPLSRDEDESTRNFRIFLAILALSLFAGGLVVDRLFKRKSKSTKQGQVLLLCK